MEKGKWFLSFLLEVCSVSSIGETMGELVCFPQQVKIHLLSASNEIEATRQAKALWSIRDNNFIPSEFCEEIKQSNDLKFLNPKIVYEGVNFEKALF
ncbi:MAG: hypothetical protein KAV41_03270 [Candidatus Pacebacteria bacterium]|nr:hypothetical protein [Candidatus Paceibacterota bacterium]